MEKYLIERGWVTAEDVKRIDAEVSAYMEKERAIAEASPMPDGADAGTNVYFPNDVDIPVKYGPVKVREANKDLKLRESSAVTHYK